MENQPKKPIFLQTANTQDSPNVELCKKIFRLNLLTSYPISDERIEAYASAILKLNRCITPKVVELIVDMAIIGKININVSEGVRCIFSGLEQLGDFKTGVFMRVTDWSGEVKRNLPFREVMTHFPERIDELNVHCLKAYF